MPKVTGAAANPDGINVTYDDGTSSFIKAIPAASAPNQNDNFQLIKNASTGRMAQVSKTDFANIGQALSDYAGYTPVGYSEWLPGVSDAPKISDGTDEIEANYNADKNNLNSEINGEAGTGGGVGDVLSGLEGLRNNINTFTSDELKRIQGAGEGAGSEYDPLISEAIDKRKQTLASQIVRAGQMGGFENTQMAGVAAIAPTQGAEGEPFVGAGGKLDYSRQLLDRNVSALKDARLKAISAARSAEQEFIRTGKRQDYEDAVSAVKLANDLKKDAEDMMIKREQLVLSQNREARETDIAYAQEARLSERLQFDKEAFAIGEERLTRAQDLVEEKWVREISDKDREVAQEAIKNMATGMVSLEGFTDEEISKLEITAGLVPGTFEAFYNGLVKDAQKGDLIDDLKIEKAKADIANTYDTIKKRKAGGSGGSGGSGTNMNKLLSVDEAKKLGVPFGTTVGQAAQMGITVDGSSEDASKENIKADMMAATGGDKKVNSREYMTTREEIKANSPELLSWFDKTYKVGEYINTNNPMDDDVSSYIGALQEEDEDAQAVLDYLSGK